MKTKVSLTQKTEKTSNTKRKNLDPPPPPVPPLQNKIEWTLKPLANEQSICTREATLNRALMSSPSKAERQTTKGIRRGGLPWRNEATLYLVSLNSNIKTPESWS